MKAKPGFILRNLVGERVLMPVGDNIGKFQGAVLMNELSAFIWDRMQTPITRDELLADIMSRYDIEEQTAAKDLDELLGSLKDLGLLGDEP